MATPAQIAANRKNAQNSTGPRSKPGKDKTRFNGLKHGLRSNQVVLPDENVAEFQAELKGWADDWQPKSHTRAVLVERAAVASWRLRRCVRAESDLLMELAARADDKGKGDGGVDHEVRDRVNRADERLFHDPAGAVEELRSMPAGVDMLIWRWGKLEEALDDGPEAWEDRQHSLLLDLLGLDDDADPAGFGQLAADSHRLVQDSQLRGDDDEDPGLMPYAEVAKMESRIRKGIARERDALREHRRGLVAPAGPAAVLKFVNVSPEIMLLHRYEMAHERSLRAAIKDLVALEKSGADLGGRMEVIEKKRVASSEPAEAGGGSAPVEAAPTEANSTGRPITTRGPKRGREGRARAVEAAEGAVSPPSHS
ncbi:MAG TPA: hypothetical protein VGH33_18260 [Isosphaeraceae bacterium]